MIRAEIGQRFVWRATPGQTCEVISVGSCYGADGWKKRVKYVVVAMADGLDQSWVGKTSSAPAADLKTKAVAS